MQQLQRYLLLQLLTPLAVACGALAVLALLTQTLSSLSLLVDDGETFLLLLQILALTLPQLMALVLPVALFIAVIQGLNRMQSDSELVVASTAGLSRWGMISPVLRLTTCVMIVQLAIGLYLQPASHREMRRTLHEARVEMAASLFQPGEFTRPAQDLTIFVRGADPDGVLRDLMIEDRRNAENAVVYWAKRGRLIESATTPAIMLEDGSMQTIEDDGSFSYLGFASVPFQLGQFIEPPGQLLYKLSDRFLYELMFPNPSNNWERDNADAMVAEGHARLAAPLYDLAIALIACFAILGGDFRRRGHASRIAAASLGALALRVTGFVLQAGAAASPALNPLQYALPSIVALALLALYFAPQRRRRLTPRLARKIAGEAALAA